MTTCIRLVSLGLLLALAAGASLALPISSEDQTSSWSAWTLRHNKTYGADEVR